MIKRNLIGFLLLFIATISVQAQGGWQKTYPINCTDCSSEIAALTQAADGGYIALENVSLPPSTGWRNDTIVNILRITSNGDLLWRKPVLPAAASEQKSISIITTPNDNFLLNFIEYGDPSIPGSKSLYTQIAMKIDINGNQIWRKDFLTAGYSPPNEINIAITNAGNYMFATSIGDIWSSSANTDIYMLDTAGTTIWTKNYPFKYVYSISPNSNDGFSLAGLSNTDVSFFKGYDNNGTEIWTRTPASTQGYGIVKELPDRSYIAIGEINNNFIPTRVTKLDSLGITDWSKVVAQNFLYLKHIVNTFDDGYILIQRDTFNDVVTKLDSLGNSLWSKQLIDPSLSPLVKNRLNLTILNNQGYNLIAGNYNEHSTIWQIDSSGFIFPNQVNGNVYFDANSNCIEDNNETTLSTWVVEAIQNGSSYFGLTDSLGNYSIGLNIGQATISTYPPASNSYWQICNNNTTINLLNAFDTLTVNLGAQAQVVCPSMIVDIATPSLRQCCLNTYTVNYCNYGTEDALNSYVEVDFDDNLLVSNSSIPWTNQVGNTYTFQIGDLDIGECGQFTVNVLIDTATNVVLGETHCTEAYIFPDTICVIPTNWNGAMVTVDGVCDLDTVHFTIKNIGIADMSQQLDYLVIEDNLIMSITPYKLNQGDSIIVRIPANGSTYRIVAEQEINHPFSKYATDFIEGCASNSSFSIGFINIFSNDDGTPFLDIDCTQNIGSYDPNDKQANPIGIGVTHDIFQNVAIDYMIRFQNTGTDTAFNIVILDTIDTDLLDITSIQFGASSHSYQASIVGQNLVKFTFANIMLPDSNVNEATSHGFVKFKINQQIDNSFGSLIENTAGIYFDFNPAIITNTTFHTVAPFPVTVSTNTPSLPEATSITVFPNPFLEKATFRIDDKQPRNLQFTLYDITGRIVHEQYYEQTYQFEFYKNQMASGMYFYTLRENGKNINQGKIVIK